MTTIYYVHFGPLADYRREAINRTRCVMVDSPVTVITDENFAEPLRAMCGCIGWPKVPRRFDPTHPKGRVLLGDWLRFWFASQDPEAVTLCSDCSLLRPVDRRGAAAGAMRDICVTSTGGDCNVFLEAMRQHAFPEPRMLLHSLRLDERVDTLIKDVDYWHAYDHGAPDEHWQKQWFYRNEYTSRN